MKVVHLCTFESGGAGKAAYRLNRGLQTFGVDSSFLVASRCSNDAAVFSLPFPQLTSVAGSSQHSSNLWGALSERWDLSLAKYPTRPEGLEIFTDTFSPYQFSNMREIADADIINFHWMAGFLNYEELPTIFRGKKLYWTIHDMNPFTGGCHYTGTCTGYNMSCGCCPQLGSNNRHDLSGETWQQKFKAYRDLDITIISPSKWLSECSKTSSLFGQYEHVVIPNGVPLDVFMPLNRAAIRAAFNIPPQAKVVLFGADDVSNIRKGFKYLLRALHEMKISGQVDAIILAIIGNCTALSEIPCEYQILNFGHIADESQMAMIYNAADVFTLPSLEDNLPNTVVESLACGTPVVGFDVGGVSDMVEHGKSGYLAPVQDVVKLAHGIEWCLTYEQPLEMRQLCRKRAEDLFGVERQAKEYNVLYSRQKKSPCFGDLHKNRTVLPKISIVTPSYNQAEYLEECIESILSQNYPNLEYIIMDGGSTDGSVEIIKKYEKQLTYWQSKPDGGQYQAINEGFRRSSGEIMTWLNSDDKYHAGALHLVELAFRAMPQTDWITGRPTAWDDLGTLTTIFDHVPLWSQERLLFHGKDDYYIQQESTFWRRALWDRAGGKLDTTWQLAADFELWCRFFNYSQLVGVDALLGGFRYHSGQKTDTMMDRYEQEVLQIIDRVRRSAGMQNAQSRPPAVVGMGEIISAVAPKLTPDAFSYFSYSRRPHFNWFEASGKKLFGSAVHPDYCDLKMYQDLLCYTFIVDNLPKGSRLLEVGGCDSRVLKALKYDYECWNVDKLEGLGNGLTEVTVDGYRMVQAYLGDFSEELPDGYFDFVFSISALEHVEENEENFNNICRDMDRVMKPGAFSLHCFDVVAKRDSVWTNTFLPFLFRRYETMNRFTPFEQMLRDPALYCMAESAYNRGWINITNVPYTDFGRPLSGNILWQKNLDQPASMLPSLQDMVPDLKSLIAWYCDENKNSFTSSEADNLKSAMASPLDFLHEIQGPLFADNHTGWLVKHIMLSRHGKAIRTVLPKFRPYCLNYFPQMMINILSDGAVTTCCFDAYGDNRFGSIYEKHLADIWEHDLPRVMQGDLYDYKRCLQCIGFPGWAPLVNEEGKREEWLEWMNRTPNEIQIEISSHCNYACVSCPSTSIRKQRAAFLDLDKTFENIRSLLKKTHKLNLYNYGEPLLHSGFSDFIRKCRTESAELILELATNGMLLNEGVSRALIESRVDRIIVSVHGGPGTENMLKYSSHGADYDTVLNNVRRLLQLRRICNSPVPKVSLRAILFHWNDNDEDMNRFRDDARSLGLSATWGHYDTDNYHWMLDSGNQLASRKYIGGSVELKALVASREFFSSSLYEEECKKGTFGGGGQAEEPAMIVVATSIAPGNTERQQKAIQSWLDNGFAVISVNIPVEIELLEDSFPDVIFVKAERDGRERYGRPLVFLDDVFSALAATGSPLCGIINSDICLTVGTGTRDYISGEAQGALVIGHRIDVDRPESVEGTVYRNGFDVFFFSRDLCSYFPPSEFCLGTTWWDIWAPLTIVLKGVPVKQLITPLAYHVIHDNRWNENEWQANCESIITIICSEANGATEHAELVESARIPLQHKDYIDFFSVVRDYILLKAEKISLPDIAENPEHQKPATTKIAAGDSASPAILVSAIVSTYNAEKFFSGCLVNLFGQTLYEKGQLEIIIINSGSEQNEESIARHCMETHDHIVYQRTERETLYAAWNRGIALASGTYITHANTDDRHQADAFEKMARTLEQHDVGLVYVDALMTTVANENSVHNSAGKIWLLPDFNIRQALLDCPFGCQVMWRRAVHEQVGMFDASYKRAGDYEFFLRVALNAGAMHLPEVLALYHESPDNLSYQAPDEVIEEVNRFIGPYRRQLPLEIIYPFLQQDSSPSARAAALVDFANNLMGISGFLFSDTQLAETLYRQAHVILPHEVDILGNLVAACIVNGNTAEAGSLMQSAAPSPRLLYYHNMLADRTVPELGLARLEHPGLNSMQAVKTAHEIRVPWSRAIVGSDEKTIVIDGVIFQLQYGRPFGISRMWLSLLTELAATPLAGRIVLLDREGTAPEITGIRRRRISAFQLGRAREESAGLDRICDEEQAGLFISTYYTYTALTPSLQMLYDMIPERFNTVGPDAPNPEWRDKYHAIVNSSGFAAISNSTARDLTTCYPQVAERPLTVVPCAVSADFRVHSEEEIAAFKAANGIDRPYYLLVGRRDPHKNAALFFHAFAQLPDRERYAIVMAGGGNTLEPELRELAGPAAGYAGFFSDQDLSLAYSGAIALVYPSLYEGFGLPILEAMQSGCPVITCQNSSLAEVAGSAALYVGEYDREEMTKALLSVQQPEVRSYLIKRGLERAGLFSWQKSAELLTDVIRKRVVTHATLRTPGGN